MSEEEEAGADKKSKEAKDAEKAKEGGYKEYITSFYFNSNGSPQYENIFLVLLLSSCLCYYLWSKNPSKEITYMDFVNQYLN